MLEFSWERDVEPQASAISWKSDAVRLTRLYPRVASKEDPSEVAEPGSFFNLFESATDPFDVSSRLISNLFTLHLALFMSATSFSACFPLVPLFLDFVNCEGKT